VTNTIRITTFRPASDLAWAVALDRARFGADAWEAPQFRAHLAAGGGAAVAWAGDRRVGVVWWSWAERTLYVASLAVAADAGRRGVGSALLMHCLAMAPDRVALHVRVDNVTALRLYEGLGFRATRYHPGYYSDGTAALYLTRP
jgi:ribosomal protein S18 acetylase RimI-like enzyme